VLSRGNYALGYYCEYDDERILISKEIFTAQFKGFDIKPIHPLQVGSLNIEWQAPAAHNVKDAVYLYQSTTSQGYGTLIQQVPIRGENQTSGNVIVSIPSKKNYIIAYVHAYDLEIVVHKLVVISV